MAEAVVAAIAASAGAVVAGASLASTSIQALSQGNGIRNVVIQITNETPTSLFGGKYHLHSGNNATPPPASIASNTVEAIVFRHQYHTATGTAGVLQYKIDEDDDNGKDDLRFAIVFSVPFDYTYFENWFGVKFLKVDEKVDSDLYDSMYADPAWKNPDPDQNAGYEYAKSGKPVMIFHDSYIVTGSMSNVSQAVLKVNIMKTNNSKEKNIELFQ